MIKESIKQLTSGSSITFVSPSERHTLDDEQYVRGCATQLYLACIQQMYSMIQSVTERMNR